MLNITLSNNFSNSCGVNLTAENLTELFDILIDLHSGKEVKLSERFAVILDPKATTAPLNELTVAGLRGYISYPAINYFSESLVLQLTGLGYTDSNDEAIFTKFIEYLKVRLPRAYYKVLAWGLTKASLGQLFSKDSLILLSFKDDILQFATALPAEPNIEYLHQMSVIRTTQLLSDVDKVSLEALYAASANSIITLSLPRPSFWRAQPSNLSFFVRPAYLRLGSYEFNVDRFSLLVDKFRFTGMTYKASTMYANALSILINPDTTVLSSVYQTILGTALLMLNTNGYYNSFPTVPINTSLYPLVLSTQELTKYVVIQLQDEDVEFLSGITALDTSLIYTKSKTLYVAEDATVPRGCKTITNGSNTLRVIVRDEKKKASDEEAYKNRIFRDYLSHAISLVCIPIFQKEFVIPDCLSGSFEFKMASLTATLYRQVGYTQIRTHGTYSTGFISQHEGQPWCSPFIPTTLPAKKDAVKLFIKELASKTLVSATQANSSIFTRHFVEPFVESIHHGWYAQPVLLANVYGWMTILDSYSLVQHVSYNLQVPRLLRTSAKYGDFYSGCGLLSNKTFGVKTIMGHVYVKPELGLVGTDVPSSINGGKGIIQKDKHAQCGSALCDIYTANFVPHDETEAFLRTLSLSEYKGYSDRLARVNQLLFLSQESLDILEALYACNDYTELADCLDTHMPTCLNILSSLNYSGPLKNHVSCALNYFWNTTRAIAEELTPHDSIIK